MGRRDGDPTGDRDGLLEEPRLRPRFVPLGSPSPGRHHLVLYVEPRGGVLDDVEPLCRLNDRSVEERVSGRDGPAGVIFLLVPVSVKGEDWSDCGVSLQLIRKGIDIRR